LSEIEELLERFRRGAELLAVATTGAAGPELDFKPEGAWSVRQIVCHLADIEAAIVIRFRQVIAEDDPFMPGLKGEEWARSLDYDRRKISNALETFRILRSANHELLKSLPEGTFDRTGVHGEIGKVTLLDLLRTYAEHVENHVRQLQRTRAAYREHKTHTNAPRP
jgi:DinB superfamily